MESRGANGDVSTNLNGSLGGDYGTYESIDDNSRVARVARAKRRGSIQASYDDNSQHLLPRIAPKDRYFLIQLGFFLLGLTTLLPWNFFITATDYWMYKFRNVSVEHDPGRVVAAVTRTPLQTFFESYLAIAANGPMVASMLANSLYGQRFRPELRIYVSLGVMLATFATTTIFVLIDTDEYQTTFFVITLLLVILTSIFSAIFQASMFGLVASFPNKCMHTMVTGQGFAGLFAVFLQTISMVNNTRPEHSALWYFLISTNVLAIAIICYWLMDTEYSRYYLEQNITPEFAPRVTRQVFFSTFKQVWPLAISTMLAFWVSLSIYPGVCVLIVPQHPNVSPASGRFFTTLTTFLIYNVGDIAGRATSAFLPFPTKRQKSLLALTLLRVVIPPIILLCNVQPRSNFPVIFESDIVFIVTVAITSSTCGYIFSSSMVMASNNSKREHLELTGFIIATFLGIGLSLGSLTSNLLLRIV